MKGAEDPPCGREESHCHQPGAASVPVLLWVLGSLCLPSALQVSGDPLNLSENRSVECAFREEAVGLEGASCRLWGKALGIFAFRSPGGCEGDGGWGGRRGGGRTLLLGLPEAAAPPYGRPLCSPVGCVWLSCLGPATTQSGRGASAQTPRLPRSPHSLLLPFSYTSTFFLIFLIILIMKSVKHTENHT